MSLLLSHGLPFSIDGEEIYTSFRNMILLEKLWQNAEVTPVLKPALALGLLYKNIPENIEKAMQGLLWFYRCGKNEKQGTMTSGKQERIYSFEHDEGLIYAAFYQTYGINLASITFLHWWEFCALLEGLPETTLFSKVIGYRTMSLDGMEPKQKAYYQKLKQHYKLPNENKMSSGTKTQNEDEMQEWIDKRFKMAEGVKENGV